MRQYFFSILIFLSFFFPREGERARQDFTSFNQNEINQSRDEEELLEFIESTMSVYTIPGVSVSIVKDGAIVWDKQFGYSNIDEGIEVSQNTMFMLASVSKTVTATALMQLWEQGFFELDDNINIYLPFNISHPDYFLAPISFRMLLSHTSGIKDNWSVMPYFDGDSDLDLGYYLEEYLIPGGLFYNGDSNFTDAAPGTNYSYSNIGAALIGYLVESISQQPFNEYCNENIFEPLGMDDTFWFLSEVDDLSQVASPYILEGGSGDSCNEIGCGFFNSNNPCQCDDECTDWGDCCFDYEEVCGEGGTGSGDTTLSEQNHYGYSDYPSGQLRTSSNNLAKLMSTYISGGAYNGVSILNSETIELIKTIHYPNINSTQGLVWYYKNSNGRQLFGHNGGDTGVSTDMFVSFSDDLGVIVLTNLGSYSGMIQIENAVFDFAEQATFVNIGDINSDQILDILDIVLMVSIILEEGEYNNIADMNSDQIINILDVILLANIILE